VIKGMVVANATCAVLIDESTSLARASCLVVYLRATFDERIGRDFLSRHYRLLLSSTTAEGIETALLDSLARHGLPVDYLRNHWVGLGTDGASVMTSCKSGLHFFLFFILIRIIGATVL